MRLTSQQARQRFSSLLHHVSATDERVTVYRWGKPLGALIGLRDFHRLQALKRGERLAVARNRQTAGRGSQAPAEAGPDAL